MRLRLATLVLGASLAISSPAFADNTEAGKAFDDGRKLRDQRDFDKAASAFERSVTAEPSIGAYYNLAFCYEQLGRTRDALDAYRKALKLAKDKSDPREKEANEAVTKLLDTHNYVTVLVSDEADKGAGVRVVVDGERVPQKQLKGEVFRSGTQHEVVVSAPGRKDRRVSVANKQPVTVVLGDFESAAPPPPPAPPPGETTSTGWGWQKWTGVGVGAAGLVTLGVGLVVHLNHLGAVKDLEDKQPAACRNDRSCGGDTALAATARGIDAQINEENSSAKGTLPILYGVGGALLVGGVVLYLTAPDSQTSTAARVRLVPQVGVHDTGLTVLGTF